MMWLCKFDNNQLQGETENGCEERQRMGARRDREWLYLRDVVSIRVSMSNVTVYNGCR